MTRISDEEASAVLAASYPEPLRLTRSELPIPHPYWVETWSGEAFDLMNPDPARMHIEDAAMHLSLENRFMGATGVGYSVAQHCCLVVSLLRAQGEPESVQRRGLFHDVEETWYGDWSSPLKRLLGQSTAILPFYVDLCRRAAAKAFHVEFPFNVPPVYAADMAMLAAETRDFLHARRKPRQEWAAGTLVDCSHVPKLTAWPAEVARVNFLELANNLGVEL